MDNTQSRLKSSIKELIQTYNELNSPIIDEFTEEPSPLDFMRNVSRNRPFVVRNVAKDWSSHQKWNAQYLQEVMQDQEIQVAMTPYGNADSVTKDPKTGSNVFVKPHETQESFSSALSYIQEHESNNNKGPVRYLQTQNDNLRDEFETLYSDVPKDIPFARIALQQSPDAINFWLGNSQSITAMHKDNYENIYVQVLGQKHFVLLPPIAAACVNEKRFRAATYVPTSDGDGEGNQGGEGGEGGGLEMKMDELEEDVPFAHWDPDIPMENGTVFSELCEPMRVSLEEGDMLYLPALWYHKVSQSCNAEGLCCAVNYWYDLDFSGSFWPLCSFARSAGHVALGTVVDNEGEENTHEKSAEDI